MFALIVFDCSIFEQAPAASARSVSALRTALRCRFLRSFFLQVLFVRALYRGILQPGTEQRYRSADRSMPERREPPE